MVMVVMIVMVVGGDHDIDNNKENDDENKGSDNASLTLAGAFSSFLRGARSPGLQALEISTNLLTGLNPFSWSHTSPGNFR